MEYFFDDLPDDEWISLDRILENNYSIKKDYTIKSIKSKTIRDLRNIKTNRIYPQLSLSIRESGWARKLSIHRIIATIFVPNPNPEKYAIINHINLDRSDFRKENLEWCDSKWNSQRKNQSKYDLNTRYIRLVDKKEFCGKDLEKEYGIAMVAVSITRSIRLGTTYKGSKWKIINVALEDYLSRHPIDPNGWYDDNGLHDFGKHKVRANVCGVLEVDGKLTVGWRSKNYYYNITISGKRYAVHRIIYEIISAGLIVEDNVIDHIIPVTASDTNNEFSNLRECTKKDNMNNSTTISSISYAKTESSYLLSQYDLYGNHIKTARQSEFKKQGFKSSSLEEKLINASLTSYNSLWCPAGDTKTLKTKLAYIYYKIKRNESGSFAHIRASGRIFSLIKGDRTMDRQVRKYLNTGMPAPDGYYYQQGDPQNILYDPNNRNLTKKRNEVHFTNKK